MNEVESILFVVLVLGEFYPETTRFADRFCCFAALLFVVFCSGESKELLEDCSLDAENGMMIEEVRKLQKWISDDLLLVKCFKGQLIEILR